MYMIIKKYDGEVDDVIEADEQREIIAIELLEKMKDIIENLSKLKIIHGDLKTDAFLFREPENYQTLDEIEIALTDFGTMGDFKLSTPKTGWIGKKCAEVDSFHPMFNLWQFEQALKTIDQNNPDGLWIRKRDGKL
jgi:serine/threonine protein kinase